MKKIIATIDGLKYSENTVNYAIELAKQGDTHLVGLFLEDFTYHSYKIYELVSDNGVLAEKKARFDKKDEATRKHAIINFSKACQSAGVEYSARKDGNIAIRDLLHESAYSDLVIIDRKETMTHYEENIPTRFIHDLLIDVKCPVLVVPDKYKPIEKIIMLYDGEPSSVYAIKMFSYLFPSLKKVETEILSVRNLNQTTHVPDNKLMKEFMKRHFPEATYTVIKGYPDPEVVRYLSIQKKNTLVVLGSYARGMVSRMFRASLADTLMAELNFPLFIAHNK